MVRKKALPRTPFELSSTARNSAKAMVIGREITAKTKVTAKDW